MIGRGMLAAVAVLTALASSGDTADRVTGNAPAVCAAPTSLLAIDPALARVAARVDQRQGLTIVAVGSSSTQGVGASGAARSYPSQLEADLRERFPQVPIRVVNRGKGGEEVAQMLARLDRDVIALHPDLVIWQLGTNAVLHHDTVAGERELIQRGIAQLKQSGSDVVLMDMQYAPRVIARPAYAAMETLIATQAQRSHVGLFRRFDIMRHWQAADAPQMIGPDGLHMNDRGYGCLAADLARALALNWGSHAPEAEPLGGERIAGADAARRVATALERAAAP